MGVRRSGREHVPMSDRHSFNYVECDIPEDMTLDDWRRRHRAAEPRVNRRFALRRLLGR